MSDDEAVPSFDDASKEAAYWRVKAHDLQDMLREAEESLKEFADSSKELEQEMERELAQSSKQLQEYKSRNEKLSQDKDEWKGKYQASLVEHNKTLAEMSRELDSLRESHNIYKSKLRDMELDNDELENAERMVRSSLADIETRYNQQMEKTVLMEQEIIDKDRLQEEVQRLRDELRDVTEEVAVLRDRESVRPQLSRTSTPLDVPAAQQQPTASPPAAAPTSRTHTPLLPRASLSAHARKRSTANATADVSRIESPSSRANTTARRPMVASTPNNRPLRTPIRRPTLSANAAAAGSSVRMMKDLTANMAALRSRINSACAFGQAATPDTDAGVYSAADTSAIPRPSSRLASSTGGPNSSSPLASSTSTVLGRATGPRPSFDGRTSIPVASSSLSRSVKRPSSRLSMGVGASGSGITDPSSSSPPHNYPARSMTPTMYTARARANPSALNDRGGLQAGPASRTSGTLSRSSTSTPLDFLNSEPPPVGRYDRPSSRTSFTPKDSMTLGARANQSNANAHDTSSATAGSRRRGSVSAGGSNRHAHTPSVDEDAAMLSPMQSTSRLPPIATHPNRPRGSTISGGSNGSASAAPSRHLSHSRTGSAATTSTTSTTADSVQAFREARAARAAAAAAGQRPSSRLASIDSGKSNDENHTPGPPPVNWKSRSKLGASLVGVRGIGGGD